MDNFLKTPLFVFILTLFLTGSYAQAGLTDALEAYWPFNGDSLDHSNSPGNYSAMGQNGPDYVTGNVGLAIRLDADYNQYLTVANATSLGCAMVGLGVGQQN